MDEEARAGRKSSWQRHGIVGPLLLIAIGLIFLLDNLHLLPWSGWELFWRFWPVLIIAGGLDDLIRKGQLVGPAFSISLGTILLLNTLGMLGWDIWWTLFRLWPIILIAIGLELVFGRRSKIGEVVAALLVVGVVVGALSLNGVNVQLGQPLESDEISQALGGAKTAQITLAPAGAALQVKALTDSEQLVAGVVRPSRGERFTREAGGENDEAHFTLRSTGVVYVPDWGETPDSPTWNLGLTPAIPLDLAISMGAGQADLDLKGLNLRSLDVNMAVGQTFVRLPAKGQFNGAIKGAIGQITVVVPAGMAVRIHANSLLGERLMPSSYLHEGDNVFVSPDYEKADNRVDLDLGLAIGQLQVQEAGGD